MENVKPKKKIDPELIKKINLDKVRKLDTNQIIKK